MVFLLSVSSIAPDFVGAKDSQYSLICINISLGVRFDLPWNFPTVGAQIGKARPSAKAMIFAPEEKLVRFSTSLYTRIDNRRFRTCETSSVIGHVISLVGYQSILQRV